MIGVSHLPDVEPEQLRCCAAVGPVEPQTSLEDFRVDSGSLSGLEASSLRLERAALNDVDITEAGLRALRVTDVVAQRLDAANGDWRGSEIRRVSIHEARLTGLDLAEARIEEVSFKGCKLDYVNFRHSAIEHALFEDCTLRCADFQGATVGATRFANCQLVEVNFTKAQLSSVDLRGSKLAPGGSVIALRGAIVDSLQLMDIARLLAAEVGIVVDDA